ncbi:unnamed protein product [Schistosoma curassoni]|uniref:Mediator of RNA polymerase II transcription subunit 19 n=1 Tax=Schistosoma curassoni TaxID=6186 RepID=A0A183KP53_9TREM|nr:unnamed protein product [Schistosoma curassoni]
MVCCKKQNKLNDNYLNQIHSHIDLKQLELLERQFILDCIAVRKICDDYSKANPKHGSIIPPYNGQLDPYAKSYFESLNIQKLLEKTGQEYCLRNSEDENQMSGTLKGLVDMESPPKGVGIP